MKGQVVKNTGSWYLVRDEFNRLTDCKIRGNIRLQDIKSTNPVAVGDIVDIEISVDGTGIISAIHERKNFIVRRSSNLSRQNHILASNLDLVLLLVTVNYPATSTVFIDRFLATAEAYAVPACIVINKMDLYSEAETQYASALKYLYESIQYPVFFVSALQNAIDEELIKYLQNKTTLISGNSGVGKSTFINALLPESQLKTGAISTYHNKGTHTTTFSEMFALPDGGNIIDTPGIKGFGTIDMDETDAGHYFREIFNHATNCRFANCTHRHEPGCAVLDAIEKQLISTSRYQSYLSVLSDASLGKYR